MSLGRSRWHVLDIVGPLASEQYGSCRGSAAADPRVGRPPPVRALGYLPVIEGAGSLGGIREGGPPGRSGRHTACLQVERGGTGKG
ncbi:hypothetical protein GCM10010309_63370 [Streptomyces violaceochromogenes]|nr:hypothetical protein GCM10010309_63370 [Streptomyces violaceochromogenes]